ncbi:MAG: SCO family protein [Desulfofustis sp.]|nr:SCO family protein [Desulfofustis sp.]
MLKLSHLSSRCSVCLSLTLLLSLVLFGCDSRSVDDFPVLGEVSQDFSFVNQNNEVVTPAVFQDKVYVTDFFFTTCPSICPIMTRQMTRVYEAVKDEPGVLLLSHTIDPEHDTVEVLKNYADGLGIETAKWHLVTGPQDEIFAMAKHYMLAAMKYEEAPGGYLHSGSFVLVDRQRQIRGYYDGTDSEAVDRLIDDLALFSQSR